MPWYDGKLERWNTGFSGMGAVLLGWHGSEHKIRPSSAFDSQYSIIPPFQYSVGAKVHPFGVEQRRALRARILYLSI